MFDLRSVLETELNTFSITNLDKVKDMENTNDALTDTENIVYTGGAAALGDWTLDRYDWLKGQNRVVNLIEIIVLAKSAAARAGIDALASAIAYQLDNNKLGQADILSTRVVSQTRSDKLRPGVYYKILTYEVIAVEDAGENECPVPGVLSLDQDITAVEEEGFPLTLTLTEGTVFTPSSYLWIFDFTNGATYDQEIVLTTTTASLTYDFSEPALGSATAFTLEVIAQDSTNSKYITTGVLPGITA